MDQYVPTDMYPKAIGDYTITKDPAYQTLQIIGYKGEEIGRTTTQRDWQNVIDNHKRNLEQTKVSRITKTEYEAACKAAVERSE
jgi:hypothetical protein